LKVAAEFDSYADSYATALAQALSPSGEDASYFAHGRVAWLAQCLLQIGEAPRAIMDYGCALGSTTPLLLETFAAESAVGVDVSSQLLEVASRNYGSHRTCFLSTEEYTPCEALDLVYCNGVFHHIRLDERGGALDYIFRSLRPGGFLSLWENNPWNPGTRYVMARCVFDKGAITLARPHAKRCLRSAGFEVLRSDFLFIFPRFLKWLRGMEKYVSSLPLGAQYQILCRKPVR
jgi:trans-aconitate methyltransferase